MKKVPAAKVVTALEATQTAFSSDGSFAQGPRLSDSN
jgi:hypothetical protein